jgi:hypothetical protein
MPSIFKALATITVWVLFIFGLLRLVIGLVMAFTTGPQLASLPVYLDFFVGTIALTLSVVVMLLRKKLDQ